MLLREFYCKLQSRGTNTGSALRLGQPILIPKPLFITNRSTRRGQETETMMLTQQFLPSSLSLSSLSLASPVRPPWAPPRRPLLPAPVRMGGGPRTFPGGVSKWQWKRMQAKKGKQLLKARLLRERQIYEMRKRAELRAAVSELEKPWELVEKAPTLLSVTADEQVKALADRFQKPGGFDMWSPRDGPQIFKRNPHDDDDHGSILPSRRFFPKGVVHSVRPYGLVGQEQSNGESQEGCFDDWIARGGGGVSRRRTRRKDRTEGVRLNADEMNNNSDSGSIDVEARPVGQSGRNVGTRGRVTLRPTSHLNSDGNDKRRRDSKQREPRSGNSFGMNRGRSL